MPTGESNMLLTAERTAELLASIGSSRIMIVGDIMLDEYLHGSVERISPEAPVPVVDIASTRLLLGGAANVAANVRTLGDQVLLFGVVGADEPASRLRGLLGDVGIAGDYLLTDDTRRTTIKTRIIAHSQQIVRADREDRRPLDSGEESRLLAHLESHLDGIAAVIISDYGKGVITPSLLARLIPLCRNRGLFVAVDPKDANFFNYTRVSLVTPNHHEAGFAFGRRIRSLDDLLTVGSGLLERLQAASILITRGAEGMSLFEAGREPVHIPTFARHVYDVTGAGDTVISTFVSAIAAGATLAEATVISNAAAGFTVGEIGTATITKAELAGELEHHADAGNLKSNR